MMRKLWLAFGLILGLAGVARAQSPLDSLLANGRPGLLELHYAHGTVVRVRPNDPHHFRLSDGSVWESERPMYDLVGIGYVLLHPDVRTGVAYFRHTDPVAVTLSSGRPRLNRGILTDVVFATDELLMTADGSRWSLGWPDRTRVSLSRPPYKVLILSEHGMVELEGAGSFSASLRK